MTHPCLSFRKEHVLEVKIHDNCFFGVGTIILPNTTIGPNAIIGAGSVVTKDIPEGTVYAGNPAKYICLLDDFLKKHEVFTKSHPCYPFAEYHGNWISKEKSIAMARELDTTFGYSVGGKE